MVPSNRHPPVASERAARFSVAAALATPLIPRASGPLGPSAAGNAHSANCQGNRNNCAKGPAQDLPRLDFAADRF